MGIVLGRIIWFFQNTGDVVFQTNKSKPSNININFFHDFLSLYHIFVFGNLYLLVWSTTSNIL